MIIQTATFQPTSSGVGTVEVVLGNRTERVDCLHSVFGGRETIHVFQVFSGRYRSGAKAWPARVVAFRNEKEEQWREYAEFGRDDRSPKFNKMNALFWAI